MGTTIQVYGTIPEVDPHQDEYIAACYSACEEKGATLPEEQTLANLAECIASIPTTEETEG